MKNIIFIGMPAVGKSTVGVVVAKRLGYESVDSEAGEQTFAGDYRRRRSGWILKY